MEKYFEKNKIKSQKNCIFAFDYSINVSLMSKKIESTLPNMLLSLIAITVVMATALGFVYNVTKNPIEKANKEKEITAIKEVLPAFDNDPLSEMEVINDLSVYRGKKGDEIVGYAVKTFTNSGFNGRFDLMVGFKTNGEINRIVVLEQKETPGLGTKMEEPKFKDQFLGLNISDLPNKTVKVNKDGGNIDAITAATITSRAFCDGVQFAFVAFQEISEKDTKNN